MMINANATPAAIFRRRGVVAGWILFALAYLAFFLVELRLDYNQLLEPCAGPDCNWAAITEAEFAVLDAWAWPRQAYALLFSASISINVIGYWVLGGLIFWRQRADRIGVFMSLALIVIPIASYADAENVGASYPGLFLPMLILSVLGQNFLLVFVFLFPNGRFYPRWAYLPMILVLFAASISLLGYNGLVIDLPPAVNDGLIAVFISGLIVSLAFQVWRFLRGSTVLERQQTKWVLLGLFGFLIGPFAWSYLYPGGLRFDPGQERLLIMSIGWLLINVGQIGLPASLAVAILQYRLWNIDLIIRRTLIYGSLTGALALLYFGSVVMLQAVFGGLTGEANSPLVTVISTLVIAAMFNPLRGRLQQIIDRRFYRSKYNAEQAVARFALHARDEVDTDRLADSLISAVEETMRPISVSLFLKER